MNTTINIKQHVCNCLLGLGPPMGPNIVNHTINISLRVYRVVHNSLAILTFVSFRNITLLTSVFSLPQCFGTSCIEWLSTIYLYVGGLALFWSMVMSSLFFVALFCIAKLGMILVHGAYNFIYEGETKVAVDYVDCLQHE
jgi:hypothetical protein